MMKEDHRIKKESRKNKANNVCWPVFHHETIAIPRKEVKKSRQMQRKRK